MKIIAKYKAYFISIWLITIILAVYLGYDYSIQNIGYSPKQPITFSHLVHSGNYEMKCLYCHSQAERTTFATIPNTNSCMICHIALRNETNLMLPVNISFDDTTSIKWKRVYKLPDYTHFNHSRHIRSMIDCSSCHGEVEKMDTVYQVRSLSMKWCLDCHRTPEKSIIPARKISGIFTNYNQDSISLNMILSDSNINYTDPQYGNQTSPQLNQLINNISMPKKAGKGPENCSSCHY
ncbi:MAG TPA: cytochrome c3 family protein [Candidatus Kapabacteria bacterium]|nr:cytochrome c3 family protein [Candidatus Kapabacteria bacterium]HPO61505.1 cytochrome c3 family protein [Candidatus Kapabacteria bacterium]